MSLKEDIQQSEFKNAKQEACINIFFTNNWLSEMTNQTFKKFDVTAQQYNVLRILKGSYPTPLSAAQIINRMIDKSPDLTRLINRLIKKGLVEKTKNATNKRKVDITITEEGIQLAENADPNTNDHYFLDNISEQEAKLLNTILDKIRQR